MKSVLAVVILAFSSQLFGAGAVSYSCVGRNKVDNQVVVFDLLFADSAPGAGYTNQSITIKKKGWDLDQPVVYQMFEATKKNNCKKNAEGEIYLKVDLNMTPTKQGDLADYTVTVAADCGDKDQKIDVKAYCVFDL